MLLNLDNFMKKEKKRETIIYTKRNVNIYRYMVQKQKDTILKTRCKVSVQRHIADARV